jgi:hypothetical protein
VLNRGNARQEVFHKEEDYAAFLGLEAKKGKKGAKKLPCGNW